MPPERGNIVLLLDTGKPPEVANELGVRRRGLLRTTEVRLLVLVNAPSANVSLT